MNAIANDTAYRDATWTYRAAGDLARIADQRAWFESVKNAIVEGDLPASHVSRVLPDLRGVLPMRKVRAR